MILAPAFGVILYNSLGFRSFILLALISSLISLLILFSMKFHHIDLETTSEDEKSTNSLQKFKSALHYINELKPIMDTIIIGVLFNLFYSSLVVGIPYIIKEQLSLGNSMVGILDTSSAIGMLIGGLLCNLFTDNTSYRLRIIAPLILTTGSFIGLGLTLSFEPNYFQLALLGTVLMFLFSLGLSSVNIFVSVFLQEHVKSGMLGRVISIMYTSCTAIMPLGILLFTAIFKFVNDGGLVLFFSGLILSVCLLLLIPNLMRALKKSSI